jgi:hypothetical protein
VNQVGLANLGSFSALPAPSLGALKSRGFSGKLGNLDFLGTFTLVATAPLPDNQTGADYRKIQNPSLKQSSNLIIALTRNLHLAVGRF